MTSELDENVQVTEFVTAGPKNYAYRTLNPYTGEQTTVCKVKGITLNYSASQLVNFDTIKDMVLERVNADTVTVRTERQIKRKRTADGVRIGSEPAEKTYSVVLAKRRRLDENTTVPFGYI